MRSNGRILLVPKFLLLGQRGGSQPIRLGMFAGFEPGLVATASALSEVILRLKRNPAQSRDYALIAYPMVNASGFADDSPSAADYEIGSGASGEDEEEFFKAELRKWRFNGLLMLHTDATGRGFHARTRSKLIAQEVIEPALAAASALLPSREAVTQLRDEGPASDQSGAVVGLSPVADLRPYPFEVELFLPATPLSDRQRDGLFLVITEILRLYRVLLAHGQDL